jgi:hypothetical protein
VREDIALGADRNFALASREVVSQLAKLQRRAA